MSAQRGKALYDSGYSSQQVVDIVRITYRQLDHWDRSGFIRPSVQRAKGRGRRRMYSEEDLITLKIAKRMKQERISLAKMRRAFSYLKDALPVHPRPLAAVTFLTDGKKIFHLTADPRILVDVTRRGQLVFSFALQGFAPKEKVPASRGARKSELLGVAR